MPPVETKKLIFVFFSGLFGVEAYGLTFVILMFIVYAILCGIDIFLGISRERKKMQVGSNPMGTGMSSKVTQGLVGIIWAVVCWHAVYIVEGDFIEWTLSIVGAMPLAGFCLVQLYSIVENWNLVATNPLEKKLLGIFNKFLGIGIDKLEEKADRFIAKKS